MRRDQPSVLGQVFSRRQALAAGVTRHELEWAVRSGRWLTLRRGVYCDRERYDAVDRVERHLWHGQAALLAHDGRHVLSHQSAALSFGLPPPLGALGRPTLTIGTSAASTDRQDDLIVQVAALRPGEITAWRGSRRTSLTRTVADCLRHLPGPDAVPMADAAVRTGRTTASAIADALTAQQTWPYAARGWASLRLVDGRRESWLESFSAVVLYADGISLPVPQVEVYDAGQLIARVDALWPEYATVGEADGRTKYALSDWTDLAGVAAANVPEARIEAARRTLVREKVREDRLRSSGLEMVRWGTRDLVRGRAALVRAIRTAWGRGDPRRFAGTMVVPAAADLAWPSGPESPGS